MESGGGDSGDVVGLVMIVRWNACIGRDWGSSIRIKALITSIQLCWESRRLYFQVDSTVILDKLVVCSVIASV